ncbi:MAG: TonB-dependent receptor [Acidobacteria bacterium]|nr:TonB-dependent receptor [Acidobacteriota bacterium]
MNTRILSFFFTTLSLIAAGPQFSGRVEDAQGIAIAGARISVYPAGASNPITTTSNKSGAFSFDVPESSSYLLTAETNNLSLPQGLRFEGPAPGLVLRLQPVAQRSSITVTADGLATSVEDSGKAFDILDKEALSRRNEIFFLESIRNTPGMQVQQTGGPGSIARIVTRGLRTSDTAVLIDGFRFRDTTSTQGDAGSLLSDLLVVNPDRFEACRGSESALYGTNAIGGTLNIVTDSGGGATHGQVDFEGGGLGLFRGLAKASGGQGRFQWSGSAIHLNVLDGIDGTDRYRNSGTQSFARFALNPKTSISTRLFTTEAFSQYNQGPGAKSGIVFPAGVIPGTLAFYNPQANDPDARRATRTIMGLVGLDRQLTNKLSLRLQYNRLYTNRYDANGPGGSGFQARFRDFNQFGGELDTVAARLNYAWAKRQNLLVGYEFEREHFYNFGDDNNPNPATRNTRTVGITQRSSAIYAQQQFQLFGGLILNLSGRIQDFNLRQPNFYGAPAFYEKGDLSSPPRAVTGDASIAYLIARTGTKFRAHMGRAYRAPSLYERFGTALFSGRYSIYGDPNLQPDRALSLDFGFDQYLFASKAKVAATYFYTRLQQVVGFGPVPREPYGRTSGYYNTGGALARGVELSASLQPTRKLSLQTAYTYTGTLERRPIFLTGELQSQRVFPHTYSLTASYFFTKNFDASFDYFNASSYLVPFFVSTGSRAFRFEGPRKADIAARYRIPVKDRYTLEIFTRLENVNNRTYYEAGYQTPGFWGTGGIRFRF